MAKYLLLVLVLIGGARSIARPSNDNFADALELVGSGAETEGDNTGATSEPSEPDHAGYPATASVWWRWVAPAEGGVTIHTGQSEIDTILAVYTGQDLSNLNHVASNDEDLAANASSSRVRFNATAGTQYWIAVDGFFGDTGVIHLSLSLGELFRPPPNDNFADAAELIGAVAETSVDNVAATSEPFEPDHAGDIARASVWWRWVAPAEGGVTIDASQSEIYAVLGVYTGEDLSNLTAVASNDQGLAGTANRALFNVTAGTEYWIAADGYLGDSGLIHLSLSLGELFRRPANDNFADAAELAGTVAEAEVDNTGAGSEESEPDHAGNPATASLWWRWVAPADGGVTIHTGQSQIDTVLAVYTGQDLANLKEIASNDEDPTGKASTSRVLFNATAGVQYWIAVDGFFGEGGLIHLSLNLGEPFRPPANDNFEDATQLVITNTPVLGHNRFATIETGESTNGLASAWWYWDGPESARFSISTAGSDFDTMLQVYVRLASGDYAFIGQNDDGGEGHSSVVRFSAVGGLRYFIRVAGFEGATGLIQLQVEKFVPKPFIPWALTALDGKRYSSTNFLGKVVILNFWATWCGPCIDEIPSLIELQNEYSAQGLVILGVSIDAEGPSVVRPFITEHHMTYPVAMVTPKIRNDVGGIPVIPTTFVIDRNGLLMAKYDSSTSKETFLGDILPLLAEGTVSLSVSRTNDRLRISWPLSTAGYKLMQSTYATPATWSPVNALVNAESNNYSVEIPADQTTRFFRLQR